MKKTFHQLTQIIVFFFFSFRPIGLISSVRMKSKQKEKRCKQTFSKFNGFQMVFPLNTLFNFLISPHNLRTICIFRCRYCSHWLLLFVVFFFFFVLSFSFVCSFFFCCCFGFHFCLLFLNLFVVFHLDFVNFILSGKQKSAFRIDRLCTVCRLSIFRSLCLSILLAQMFNCIWARPTNGIDDFVDAFFFSFFFFFFNLHGASIGWQLLLYYSHSVHGLHFLSSSIF